MNPFSLFETVYIEKNALGSELCNRVHALFPKEKIKILKEKEFFKKGRLTASEMNQSKKVLLIKKFKGSFFKRCPGATPKMMCCNYFVLNLGQHCEMDCSYCYLQSFINFPAVVIYSNIEDALRELEDLKKDYHKTYIRIGTGEQTDSLSLDDISLYSQKLVRFFKNCPQWLLEFKTKSSNIKNFKNEKHAKNIVVSWSVNPENIIQQEEHGTASLTERLKAAQEVRDQGFKLSFHIDPMIYHENWRDNYQALVNHITKLFSPEEVTHISVGALRFQASQKAIMRKRFGMQSLVCQSEHFKSKDGKLRYDNKLRQNMFRHVVECFKTQNSSWNIFLCMETPENWLQSINAVPKKIPTLQKDFNLKVAQKIKNR